MKTSKSLFWSFWLETQFFSQKICFFFYFCCTFWYKFNSFFVILSIIGVIQSFSEEFGCRFENSRKPPIFDVLRPKTQFYFQQKCLYFVSTPCASIRAVVLWVWVSLVWHSKYPNCSSAYLKTPKTNFFKTFGLKRFFWYTLYTQIGSSYLVKLNLVWPIR